MTGETDPTAHGLWPLERPAQGTGGLLSGLRLTTKDVFDLAGFPTGAGNPDWLRTHPSADEDALVVRQLEHAGAVYVGRTVSDELAFSLNGENMHYGTPHNPRAPGRIPGGSSSGAASSVAAGLADIGLGTDTSGSIRVPASYCGLFGIRPTHGVVPVHGVVPLAPEFDTVGWLTRDARVLAQVGEVLLPPAVPENLTDLVLLTDAFDCADPRSQEALAPALALIGREFRSVVSKALASEGLDHWAGVYRTVQSAAVWETHGAWYSAIKPRIHPDIAERMKFAAAISLEHASDMRDRARLIRETIRSQVYGGRVLCLPTTPSIAPLMGAAGQRTRQSLLALTCIAGLGGLPQITVPASEIENCPFGLSLIGPPGSDRALLSLTVRLWR